MSVRTIRFSERTKVGFATTWPQFAFVGLVAAMLFGGAAAPLRAVYPIAAVAVAIRLQQLSVAAYVSFLFWLWFLTPLVRRLADLRAGWQDPSFVLLTPYLVSVLAIGRILSLSLSPAHRRPRIAGTSMFGLAAAGITLGVPFGVFNNLNGAVVEMLNWYLPLLFGWYIATHFEHAHEITRALVKQFTIAAVVIGGYGIYQFTVAPLWDTNWIVNTEMTTVGVPEPFAIRVFSTMHSPGVAAPFLVVSLILWIARPVASGLPGAALTAGTLILSQVRSAWLAFAVSAVLVIFALKPAQQLRAFVFVVMGTIATSVFVLTPEMSELMGTRFATMQRLDDDESAMSRLEGHIVTLDFLLRQPLGLGIGQIDPVIESYLSMRDSVIVPAFVQGGLVGGSLYMISLIGLTLQLWRYYRRGSTTEGHAFACVALGMLPAGLLGVVTAGPVGFCLWTIAGLALADRHLARQRLAAVQAQSQRIRQQARRPISQPVSA